MNENTEAQTNISPDYPLNFLLAVDNKYRTYYIPADIDETIEYLLHIIFSNTPNDADILRKHFKYGKTYADIACEYQDTAEHIQQLANRAIGKFQYPTCIDCLGMGIFKVIMCYRGFYGGFNDDVPDFVTLINIATKYNVSMDWLCGIDKTNGGKYIDSKSIGLRIRTLRLERNLTQTDFAKLIFKSLRTVQKYENDEIEINISTANDIARVLDVSASYILGNDDTISSSQLPKSPQTFYEKLIYLIEDKGITKNKLLTDLKLNRNSFGNWQKQGSKPRAETMERIAEYFEVTPESLTKDNTEIQYLPTAKKILAQPTPPTVNSHHR